MKAATTEVEIFGTVYPLRGEGDGEHARELAAMVDRTMRDIARQVTTVDVTRIAILAALNLADELFQCRKGQEGEWVRVKERVAELDGVLVNALES